MNQKGKQVALNARSGKHAPTTVLAETGYLATPWGTIGPYQFTDSTSCYSGDSGGPWVQTLSGSQDVIGVGQHVGKPVRSNGQARCAFTPQVKISAAMHASIYKY